MGALDARVDAARRAVAAWRRQRRRGARMPESLWAEAASLAGVLGVSPVARRLDIGHQSLKKRLVVAKCGGVAGAGDQRPVAFMELSRATWASPAVATPGTAAAAGAVIELTSWDGTQMVVRIGTGTPVDVLGLAEAFWRRSP